MTLKTIAFGMAAILAFAATPTLSMAQGAVSQFATQPPRPPFAATQGPAIATRAHLRNVAPGSSPIVIIQSQPVRQDPLFAAPNPVFVPGEPFLPNPFALPAPGYSFAQQIPPPAMDPVHILVPGQTAIPGAAAAGVPTTTAISQGQAYFGRPSAPAASTPAAGRSRNDVLRQYGQPSVTVVTSTGETLYFDGGITVKLENGQVTGPR